MATKQQITPQQMEEVLGRMLLPESAKQATEILNKFLKQSNTMPVLLELMQRSASPAIRQLSGVMMRKKIIKHWGRLKSDMQEKFKSILLELLIHEQVPIVRKSIGEVIAIIARILLPLGQWKELLDFLLKCSQSPNTEHRLSAMILFESLTQNIGENLRVHFPVLVNIFTNGLNDTDAKVRIEALKGVGSLVQLLTRDEDFVTFRQLVPLMMNVISHCLSTGNDDEAMAGFEVFADLIELPIPTVSNVIPDIIKFVLEIGANKNLDQSIRQKALDIIEWTASYKAKTLTKGGLIGPILSVVFPMCAEEDTQDEDDEDDDVGHVNPRRYAAALIDQLAIHIPSKHILGPAMEYVTKFISSPNVYHKKAAMLALAVLAEGCSADMRDTPETLSNYLQLVYAGMKDSDQGVRECACTALGQFSSHLQPEISEHYKIILPLLFEALSDPTPKVKMSCCYAIESFCQNLGEEIQPYLEPMLTKLVNFLQSENLELKGIAISAISAIAIAAGKVFLPFYDALAQIMVQLMSTQIDITQINHNKAQDDLLHLKCRATECLGLISLAVGKEVVGARVNDFMNLALVGTALDSHELREYTYGFFGNIAEMYKADFAQFLPVVIPILLASCESNDGLEQIYGDDEDDLGIDDDGDDEEEGGEQYDLDEGGDSRFAVRTAFLQEKCAAAHALGTIAQHVGASFLPFAENVYAMLKLLVTYFHDEVRKAVLHSYVQVLCAIEAALPGDQSNQSPHLPKAFEFTSNSNIQAEETNKLPQVIHPTTKAVLDHMTVEFYHVIERDDDAEVATAAADCLSDLAKKFSHVHFVHHMDGIIKALIAVLTKKATCQKHEVDDEEEDAEIQLALIDSTCECLINFAKSFGSFFDSHFQVICPHIVKYYQQKSNADTYRSLAIGTLADLCKYIGQPTTKYLASLTPIAYKAMTDQDPGVRSNAAYLLGLLLLNGHQESVPYYNQSLMSLSTLFNDTTIPNILDNACGAVCRMINANPTAVPLNQVLPILFKSLPLRIDLEEPQTVYNTIFNLFQTSNPALIANFGGCLAAFARTLGSTIVDKDIQSKIVQLIKSLTQSNGALLESASKSLTPEELQNLQKYMQ